MKVRIVDREAMAKEWGHGPFSIIGIFFGWVIWG